MLIKVDSELSDSEEVNIIVRFSSRRKTYDYPISMIQIITSTKFDYKYILKCFSEAAKWISLTYIRFYWFIPKSTYINCFLKKENLNEEEFKRLLRIPDILLSDNVRPW